MQELKELSDASQEDIEKFDAYIKVIHQLDDFIQSLVMDTPDIITDEIHDAQVRIMNDFVFFIKNLKPEQR